MKKQVEITVDAMSEAFDKYRDFSCTPKTKAYRVGDIIDEEKSVKWNREEVDRLRHLRIEEIKLLNKQKQELYEEFKDMVCKYIMEEIKVCEERSKKIFDFLGKNYYLVSNGQFYCDILDDFLEAFYK